MQTTKLSTKGQIVLPKEIRSAHAWGPGTEFTVEETAAGILLRPTRPFPPTKIEDVAGRLHPKLGKAKTIQDMDAAIRQAVMRRHASGRY